MNIEKLSCVQPYRSGLRVSAYWVLIPALIILNLSLKAQTTDISGIVNTYHKVVEVIPTKACLRVTNVGVLNQNRRVLITQMKGATIQTGTGATFGDTVSLNQAGHYEVGTICYIIGDSVFLFHDLLNTYDTASKVQLVQFAEYFSARVVGTVRAQLWDSTAGTGGVIALDVDETLELNAPIWGDTAGYKGGLFFLHNGTCDFFNQIGTQFAYNPTNANASSHGAYKGESVASLSTIDIFGAKGAPANGGGGGNNHNNSGGGGANLNTGGRGGGNSSSAPFFCITANGMGLGGKALRSWAGRKIFMGGGGGAGQNNYGGITNGGGEGGAIVFIHANTLIGNGNTISANGGPGANSLSDGAGGGGAGGTIIMDVTTYTGAVNITANGGKGGDSDDSPLASRCFGGGGGGSGGVIYFTGATPPAPVTTSITGGAGGAETGSSGTCNTPIPGLPGAVGVVIPGYVYSRSTSPAGYCELLLPVKLISFTAQVINKKVLLKWSVENPSHARSYIIERSLVPGQWLELKTIIPDDQVRNYSTYDDDPFKGRSYYRLRIIENNNSVEYSPVRPVEIAQDQLFSVFPNPAKDKITVVTKNTTSADIYIYDMAGKLILRKKPAGTRTEINIDHLQSGIYFIRIDGNTQKLFLNGNTQ